MVRGYVHVVEQVRGVNEEWVFVGYWWLLETSVVGGIFFYC
jgi:hypothetical protein